MRKHGQLSIYPFIDPSYTPLLCIIAERGGKVGGGERGWGEAYPLVHVQLSEDLGCVEEVLVVEDSIRCAAS